jgi:hypothetical protein
MSDSLGTGAAGAHPPNEPRRADEKHCHACGQIVHATAVACPHCGAAQAMPPALKRAGPLTDRVPGALPSGHVYCRGCGHGVHQTATACPLCGAPQSSATLHLSPHAAGQAGDASPWLAGFSLALGLICILALFDPSDWDSDTLIGYFSLAIAGLATGIGSTAAGHSGRSMAIVGIVLSSVALLAGIGLIGD